MSVFEHLVFDLDDTLLDTHRLLIPRASRDACVAMIDAGLKATIEQCLEAWDEHSRHNISRREIFTHLVQTFGVREDATPEAVQRRGYHAFYNRKVETDITLFPGVREMLKALDARHTLHLVTSGSRVTQEEKIRILEIRPFFASIHHVDPTQGQKKRDAFAQIQTKFGSAPEKHLSIGNRIDTDIGEARELGWKGCWVKYGEHVAMEPATPSEKPDFIINDILELTTTCQL